VIGSRLGGELEKGAMPLRARFANRLIVLLLRLKDATAPGGGAGVRPSDSADAWLSKGIGINFRVGPSPARLG
jgi:hypothetical protein